MQAIKPLLKSVLLFSLLAGGLAGCSYLTGDDGYFRDRQGDYMAAPIEPPMQVPPELDSFTLQEMFPIPSAEMVEGGTFLIPPAPREMDDRVREGVIIQRFGDRRWILIGATPGQVWPRLRDFWVTAQLPIALENPIEGTVETEWMQAPDGSREKYRARIEPGLHAGNSEVYVVHIAEAALSGSTPADLLTSHDLERENQLLTAISVYLADRTDLYRASSVSLLAGSIANESKAQIVRGANGELEMELQIDFERAWGQVGQSMSAAGVQIVDSIQSEATYAVLFAGATPEEQPGFFRRTFGRSGDRDDTVSSITVRLVRERDNLIRVSAESVPSVQEQDQTRRNELIEVISDNLN